jgi:hypothetical protein
MSEVFYPYSSWMGSDDFPFDIAPEATLFDVPTSLPDDAPTGAAAHAGLDIAPAPDNDTRVDPVVRACLLVGDEPRLGSSHSPVFDALVFCAVRDWGVHLVPEMPSSLYFSNFAVYHHCAALICRKGTPTRHITHRVKALRVWFLNVPTTEAGLLAGDFCVWAKDKYRAQELLRKVEETKLLIQTRRGAVSST